MEMASNELVWALWSVIFLILCILAGIITMIMYRHFHSLERTKQVRKVRYLGCVCIILQILTFVGYFGQVWLLHELMWTLWIPCFTIALSLLSFNIVTIYLNTSNVVLETSLKHKKKSKFRRMMQKVVTPTAKKISNFVHSPKTGATKSPSQQSSTVEEVTIDHENDENQGKSDSDYDNAYDGNVNMMSDTENDDAAAQEYQDEVALGEQNGDQHAVQRYNSSGGSSPASPASRMSPMSAESPKLENEIANSNNGCDFISLCNIEFFHFKGKYKIAQLQPQFWRGVWVLWVLCSIADWIGSILGWFFHLCFQQAIFYSLWKFIAGIMLLLCIFVLYKVKIRCQIVNARRNSAVNQQMAQKLAAGINRLRDLIICEILVAFSMFVGSIYEVYIATKYAQNSICPDNAFVQTNNIWGVIVYFPLWTFVHVILIYYTWIPKRLVTANH